MDIFSSIKGMSRLISKGMSNISLKLLLRKTDANLCPYEFWGAPTHAAFCFNLKTRGLEAKLCVAFLLF